MGKGSPLCGGPKHIWGCAASASSWDLGLPDLGGLGPGRRMETYTTSQRAHQSRPSALKPSSFSGCREAVSGRYGMVPAGTSSRLGHPRASTFKSPECFRGRTAPSKEGTIPCFKAEAPVPAVGLGDHGLSKPGRSLGTNWLTSSSRGQLHQFTPKSRGLGRIPNFPKVREPGPGLEPRVSDSQPSVQGRRPVLLSFTLYQNHPESL